MNGVSFVSSISSELLQDFTHSYLLDEIEPVFLHPLLSLYPEVGAGLRLRPHARLEWTLSGGGSSQEGLGKRDPSGVFTWQVAHRTQHSGSDVHVGAELASPL